MSMVLHTQAVTAESMSRRWPGDVTSREEEKVMGAHFGIPSDIAHDTGGESETYEQACALVSGVTMCSH